MAEQTIITWNATNWVTILVMVSLGFLLLAVIAQSFHNWRGTPGVATSTASDN